MGEQTHLSALVYLTIIYFIVIFTYAVDLEFIDVYFPRILQRARGIMRHWRSATSMLWLFELYSESIATFWICWGLWNVQWRWLYISKYIILLQTLIAYFFWTRNLITQNFFILGRYQSNNGWGGSVGFGRPVRFGSPIGMIFPNRYGSIRGYSNYRRLSLFK